MQGWQGGECIHVGPGKEPSPLHASRFGALSHLGRPHNSLSYCLVVRRKHGNVDDFLNIQLNQVIDELLWDFRLFKDGSELNRKGTLGEVHT